MNTAKPLRADARRNREALLSAAREVLDAGEFFDLRFDDLAGLAGVGVGTLYRHFPTREALLEAVYHAEVVTLSDRADELRATLPPHEALAAFLREMVDHMDTHQGLARALATLMAARSGVPAEESRALEEAVAELVADAVRAGTVRADADAGAVLMALHGIGAAHDHRPGWRAEADGVVTLLLDGLRLSAPSAHRRPPDRARPGARSAG